MGKAFAPKTKSNFFTNLSKNVLTVIFKVRVPTPALPCPGPDATRLGTDLLAPNLLKRKKKKKTTSSCSTYFEFLIVKSFVDFVKTVMQSVPDESRRLLDLLAKKRRRIW